MDFIAKIVMTGIAVVSLTAGIVVAVGTPVMVVYCIFNQ